MPGERLGQLPLVERANVDEPPSDALAAGAGLLQERFLEVVMGDRSRLNEQLAEPTRPLISGWFPRGRRRDGDGGRRLVGAR